MDLYDLPTHLDQEDRPYWGLTLRQFVLTAGSLLGAFCVVQLLPSVAFPLRLGLAAALVAMCITLAFVQPAGRSLLAWLQILDAYRRTPRLVTWQPERTPS